MIRKQTHMSKKTKLLLILLGVLILSVIAYAIVTHLPSSDPDDTEESSLRYEPVEGESSDNRVYPYISLDNVKELHMEVQTKDGSYGLEKLAGDSNYYLYYVNEAGDPVTYYPPAAASDPNFDYTTVYSTVDMGSGVTVPMYLYLAMSATNIYFDERVPIAEETKAATLRKYGLDDSENRVLFRTSDGTNEQQHTLVIGKETVSGSGYYLLVDDRPYVYATSTSTVSYMTQPFAYYINPLLIAPGSTGSASVYEAYLMLKFDEYVNDWITTAGASIPNGVKLIAKVATRENGGTFGDATLVQYDLTALAKETSYTALVSFLQSQTLGEINKEYTLRDAVGTDTYLNFEKADTLSYHYRILSVLSVYDTAFTGLDERTTGTVGTSATTVKVQYTRQIGDGEVQTKYGLLSLSEPWLEASTVSALRALPVGQTLTESEQVAFTVVYTQDDKTPAVKLYFRDVLSITDKNGLSAATADADSAVYGTLYSIYEGNATDPTVTGFLLSELDEETRSRLVGVTKGNDQNVFLTAVYYEIFHEYSEWKIDSLQGYVQENQVVCFGFVNTTDRNPFYRETYFTNKLPTTNKYSLYGLNDTSCMAVVKAMGGIQSSSTQAAGLYGSETVAVGLTASVMEKYHLFDNTVSVTVPRGISSDESGENFVWSYSLTFTMHVSNVQYDEDGTPFRYVGSEEYDLVARVDGTDFDFLNYSFAEYWARDRMILVDIDDMSSVEVTLNTEELQGVYDFRLTHTELSSGSGTYTLHSVKVAPSGSYNAALLSSYIAANGTGADGTVALNKLYDITLGIDGKYSHAVYGKDYAGDGYFKEFLETMFYVSYTGTVDATDPTVSEILSAGQPEMKIIVTLTGSTFRYVYEFYRVSDRKIVVKLYQIDAAGTPVGTASSDFYVSTLGYKRIAGAVRQLLNGEPVSLDNGYND